MNDYSGLKYWEAYAFLFGFAMGIILITSANSDVSTFWSIVGIITLIGAMILLSMSWKWRRRVKKILGATQKK